MTREVREVLLCLRREDYTEVKEKGEWKYQCKTKTGGINLTNQKKQEKRYERGSNTEDTSCNDTDSLLKLQKLLHK